MVGTNNHLVLLGEETYSNHESLIDAFLVFLSLCHLLDMDYPENYILAFTILQHFIFRDVSCNEINFIKINAIKELENFI